MEPPVHCLSDPRCGVHYDLTGDRDPQWCRCGTSRGRQVGWTRSSEGVWVCPLCCLPSHGEYVRLSFAYVGLDRVSGRLTNEVPPQD